MLRFEGLSKSFGSKHVIREAAGELGQGAFAIQGPNGSGKSTLLALLSGAVRPDAGEVWVEGISLQQWPVMARRRLAYAPDESPVYPFTTGRDWLDFIAMARETSMAKPSMGLLEELGLGPYLDTRFSAMSLGTQKKFLLCAAWAAEGPVLLLDEPSNGLDAAAREIVARRIAQRAGHLTLFASHDAAFISAAGARVVQLSDFIACPE